MNLRINAVAIDCPDPTALAQFYSDLIEKPVTGKEPDWVEIDLGHTKLAFQLAPDLQRPQWPDPGHPQQMHLDIEVSSRAELPEAEQRALALGARRLPGGDEADDGGFHVFEDPAGHPFCFVWHI